MKLESLEIELHKWGEQEGKYTAKIKWLDETGKIEMSLDPKISEALLSFIGPVITKFSHEAALNIEQSLVKSVEEARAGKPIQIA